MPIDVFCFYKRYYYIPLLIKTRLWAFWFVLEHCSIWKKINVRRARRNGVRIKAKALMPKDAYVIDFCFFALDNERSSSM